MHLVKILLFLLLCCLPAGEILAQVVNPRFQLLLEKMYNKTVPLITVAEAARLQAQNPKVVFLDTREQKEYAVSHLKNAVWVGYDDFSLKRVARIPKDSPIIVYCSIGVRSEKIGEQLLQAGYKQVQNLYGSIFEWVNQGYPVYQQNQVPTPRVHAYSRVWGIWLDKGEKVF